MGCQRSGTTLVSRVLDSFIQCRTFGEFSPLSSDCPHNIRLNEISSVVDYLSNIKAPIIVTKPLVESHRANELLNSLPNSSIIWIYRHYLDVALSDLRQFPNTSGHGNLQPIINGENNNWRSEGLSAETTEQIKRIYSSELSKLDCACLFWFARNSLYFQQKLEKNENVLLWKYENLMENPKEHFSVLSSRLNDNFTNFPFENVFSTNSIKKEVKETLHPEIKALCESLLSKLDLYSHTTDTM